MKKFAGRSLSGLALVGGWGVLGLSVATLAGTVGCVGEVGSSGSGGSGDGDDDGIIDLPGDDGEMTGSVNPAKPKFSCKKDAVPTSIGLRKLTDTQYANTIRDLMEFAVGAQDGMMVWNALRPMIDAKYPKNGHPVLPEDAKGSFRQLDQALQQTHVDSSYEIAVMAGSQLGSRAAKLLGACGGDTNAANDDQCITDFVKTFGERALRRPLTNDEVTFYKGFYAPSTGIDPAGLADIVAGFLTAPQFMYMVEHGEDPVGGKDNVYNLSAFELASRLSYHLTATMPDQPLWDAAKSGALLNESDYMEQVDRLLSSPEGRAAAGEFYADYFKMNFLGELDAMVAKPDYKAFAASDLPTKNLRQNMINEVVDMTAYYTFDTGGTFDDLLTSESSFARTSDLAKIYGVSAWDGNGDPPLFPPGERPGFLTRAAFLSTGIVTTSPILKGVYIRETVLCDHIPPPPDNAANETADTSNKTTRQVVELITEQEGTGCKSCHQAYINGLGFATENFDALGRHRDQESSYAENGMVTSTNPIDTVSIPRVVSGDDTESQGAGDLMRLIGDSQKAHACFARNYFRYAFARWETDRDGCLLENMRKTLVEDKGSIKDMFRTLALAPEFKARTIASE
jgi:hypothetical protein